jgi:uncharacterized protein (DUF1778 family)
MKSTTRRKQEPPLAVRLSRGEMTVVDRAAQAAGLKRNAFVAAAIRRAIAETMEGQASA